MGKLKAEEFNKLIDSFIDKCLDKSMADIRLELVSSGLATSKSGVLKSLAKDENNKTVLHYLAERIGNHFDDIEGSFPENPGEEKTKLPRKGKEAQFPSPADLKKKQNTAFCALEVICKDLSGECIKENSKIPTIAGLLLAPLLEQDKNHTFIIEKEGERHDAKKAIYNALDALLLAGLNPWSEIRYEKKLDGNNDNKTLVTEKSLMDRLIGISSNEWSSEIHYIRRKNILEKIVFDTEEKVLLKNGNLAEYALKNSDLGNKNKGLKSNIALMLCQIQAMSEQSKSDLMIKAIHIVSMKTGSLNRENLAIVLLTKKIIEESNKANPGIEFKLKGEGGFGIFYNSGVDDEKHRSLAKIPTDSQVSDALKEVMAAKIYNKFAGQNTAPDNIVLSLGGTGFVATKSPLLPDFKDLNKKDKEKGSESTLNDNLALRYMPEILAVSFILGNDDLHKENLCVTSGMIGEKKEQHAGIVDLGRSFTATSCIDIAKKMSNRGVRLSDFADDRLINAMIEISNQISADLAKDYGETEKIVMQSVQQIQTAHCGKGRSWDHNLSSVEREVLNKEFRKKENFGSDVFNDADISNLEKKIVLDLKQKAESTKHFALQLDIQQKITRLQKNQVDSERDDLERRLAISVKKAIEGGVSAEVEWLAINQEESAQNNNKRTIGGYLSDVLGAAVADRIIEISGVKVEINDKKLPENMKSGDGNTDPLDELFTELGMDPLQKTATNKYNTDVTWDYIDRQIQEGSKKDPVLEVGQSIKGQEAKVNTTKISKFHFVNSLRNIPSDLLDGVRSVFRLPNPKAPQKNNSNNDSIQKLPKIKPANKVSVKNDIVINDNNDFHSSERDEPESNMSTPESQKDILAMIEEEEKKKKVKEGGASDITTVSDKLRVSTQVRTNGDKYHAPVLIDVNTSNKDNVERFKVAVKEGNKSEQSKCLAEILDEAKEKGLVYTLNISKSNMNVEPKIYVWEHPRGKPVTYNVHKNGEIDVFGENFLAFKRPDGKQNGAFAHVGKNGKVVEQVDPDNLIHVQGVGRGINPTGRAR